MSGIKDKTVALDVQETYSDFSENLDKSRTRSVQEGKKKKHNYTSELELKSLLIRIKNDKVSAVNCDNDYNGRINKYIIWHTDINNKKYQYPTRRNKIKTKLKQNIIRLSECSKIDKVSYERFGEIILLMIKNILKKPQFSGYTYKDDFYSDAVYKILKYIHNFDHTKTSKITGQPVNAFAYISQIIHNSIIYILKKKKKEQELLSRQVDMEHLNHNLAIKYKTYYNEVEQDDYENLKSDIEISESIVLKRIDVSLVDELHSLEHEIERVQKLEVVYPSDYRISFDEYNELKGMLCGKICIKRASE